MLTRFYAKNYKGLLMDPLALGRVNVFIGPNNCGKSNLFSAVSFVFDMFGRPEEGRGSLAAALKRREQGSIVTYGEDVVELGWTGDALALEYHLALWSSPSGVVVRSESVFAAFQIANDIMVQSHEDGTVNWNMDYPFLGNHHGGRGMLDGFPRSESVLNGNVSVRNMNGQLSSDLREDLSGVSQLCGMRLAESVQMNRALRLAHVVPVEVAQASRAQHVTHLDDRALDLTNLLHAWLKSRDYNSRLISELSPLLPGLTDLRVFEGGGYRWIQLQLRGEWRNLSELSDGTVIALLLAVILFAPTQSQTLIIDEPELNLHPAWARVVAGWIARQTSWAQVLIGTHSPEILDPLTEAFQQGDVSLFVFQRAEEGFRVEPCPVERLAGRISEGWMLGDLYRVGDPALGGWPW